MCGRFVASRPVEDIVEAFAIDDVDVPEELVEPRWNVAPQAPIIAVTARRPRRVADEDGGAGESESGRRAGTEPSDEAEQPVRRRLALYHWGLVPSWAKDPSFGNRAFNARAEAIEEKPAFRAAVAKRRCLVPADAFYEWKRDPSGPKRARRQPWCFRPADGGPMAFAGLWEAWRPRGEPDAPWLLSCTIITTDANEEVAPVHSRMPVVLEPEMWEEWLAPSALDPAELHALLRPTRGGFLEAFPVDPLVNDARAEGPQLWQPVEDSKERPAPDTEEPTLFEVHEAG
jgi:putative SOS response-associated peptidase YedK